MDIPKPAQPRSGANDSHIMPGGSQLQFEHRAKPEHALLTITLVIAHQEYLHDL
jgi:hypothetical protein